VVTERVELPSVAACEERLTAPAERVSDIQARVLPTEAIEVVGDNEAEQFAGAYLKYKAARGHVPEQPGHKAPSFLPNLTARL
jgi:hypothetical protein